MKAQTTPGTVAARPLATLARLTQQADESDVEMTASTSAGQGVPDHLTLTVAPSHVTLHEPLHLSVSNVQEPDVPVFIHMLTQPLTRVGRDVSLKMTDLLALPDLISLMQVSHEYRALVLSVPGFANLSLTGQASLRDPAMRDQMQLACLHSLKLMNRGCSTVGCLLFGFSLVALFGVGMTGFGPQPDSPETGPLANMTNYGSALDVRPSINAEPWWTSAMMGLGVSSSILCVGMCLGARLQARTQASIDGLETRMSQATGDAVAAHVAAREAFELARTPERT